jgi:hypothetical protein
MKMETGKEQDTWAIVELFGHARIAGKISEHTIGGCAFVRVDVPQTKSVPAFTRLLGQGAIYSITFVDELVAMRAVESIRPAPVTIYIPELKQLPLPQREAYDDDDPDPRDTF